MNDNRLNQNSSDSAPSCSHFSPRAISNEEMQRLVNVAAGREFADLLIQNCRIVNVGSGLVEEGEILVVDGLIAATGKPGTYTDAKKVVDANGAYALPGLIDSHIHIESAMVTPEEISRLLVPLGTTTLIADPHEIVNVAGLDGLNYMLDAADHATLRIEYMLPSCVPATDFESAGAKLDSSDLADPIQNPRILGIAEMMNFPGIIHADPETLERVRLAHVQGKVADGHSPGVVGKELAAYAAAGIKTDHECSTVEEMQERLALGMYVLMRQGSACHNLETLLAGVNPQNARRCLLCSDDRQPETILKDGHLNDHLARCVRFGIDPVTAVQMATLNAAEAYGLNDRGALFPGRRADINLVQDLENFDSLAVYIQGEKVAEKGEYLPEFTRADSSAVRSSCHVKDFSVKRLQLQLKGDKVNAIRMIPGGVVTGSSVVSVEKDASGDFVYNPEQDLVKCAVVERHHETGNVGVGFLENYGLKDGAIALSIAHDSHNIILAGTNNQDMAFACEELIAQEGGIVIVRDGKVLGSMPLPIAGLMSDQSGQWVDEKLRELHDIAIKELGVNPELDPIMSLCFISLPVIPVLKLTDKGLFDVSKFDFIPLEAE